MYIALTKFRKSCSFLLRGKLDVVSKGIAESPSNILFALLLQRLMENGDQEAVIKGVELLNTNIEDSSVVKVLRLGLRLAMKTKTIGALPNVKAYGNSILQTLDSEEGS